MSERRIKNKHKWEENSQIPIMNKSDTESELSNELEEFNEYSQVYVTEDTNVIHEADVSDTKVIEKDIHTKDDKEYSANRSNDS